MASDVLCSKLKGAKRDLDNVVNTQQFTQIGNTKALLGPFSEARNLAFKWFARVESFQTMIDDDAVNPLIVFMERLTAIGEGRGRDASETIVDAIRKLSAQFVTHVPTLTFGLLEASGVVGLSSDDFPHRRNAALGEINSAGNEGVRRVNEAIEESLQQIRNAVKDAEEDVERAKKRATKISVESAQEQFKAAAGSLRWKALWWLAVTCLFFGVLIWRLWAFTWHPPTLIQEIVEGLKPRSNVVALPVSVPLLVAASAYFTSLRLALIGVLGVGLAFSLRMAGAYLQMIEHNWHKLRVTNSIEAFVASVRTEEQKDFVLGKLVESVTQFGDSGILGRQNEASGFPSVLIEAMTKNINKPG